MGRMDCSPLPLPPSLMNIRSLNISLNIFCEGLQAYSGKFTFTHSPKGSRNFSGWQGAITATKSSKKEFYTVKLLPSHVGVL